MAPPDAPVFREPVCKKAEQNEKAASVPGLETPFCTARSKRPSLACLVWTTETPVAQLFEHTWLSQQETGTASAGAL